LNTEQTVVKNKVISKDFVYLTKDIQRCFRSGDVNEAEYLFSIAVSKNIVDNRMIERMLFGYLESKACSESNNVSTTSQESASEMDKKDVIEGTNNINLLKADEFLMKKLPSFGLKATLQHYNILLMAFLDNNDFPRFIGLCNFLNNHKMSDLSTLSLCIRYLLKTRQPEEVEKFLKVISEAILQSAGSSTGPQYAKNISLQEFQKEAVSLIRLASARVMVSYLEKGELEKVEILINRMSTDFLVHPTHYHYNTLLNYYANQSGKSESFRQKFLHLYEKAKLEPFNHEVKSSESSHSTLIDNKFKWETDESKNVLKKNKNLFRDNHIETIYLKYLLETGDWKHAEDHLMKIFHEGYLDDVTLRMFLQYSIQKFKISEETIDYYLSFYERNLLKSTVGNLNLFMYRLWESVGNFNQMKRFVNYGDESQSQTSSSTVGRQQRFCCSVGINKETTYHQLTQEFKEFYLKTQDSNDVHFSVSDVLCRLVRIHRFDLAKEFYSYLSNIGYYPNHVVATSYLNALYKEGNSNKEAEEFFWIIIGKNIVSQEFLTLKLSYLGRAQQYAAIRGEKITSETVEENIAVYLKLFRQFKFSLGISAWSAIIKLYLKCDCWNKVVRTLSDMEMKYNLIPDASLYAKILGYLRYNSVSHNKYHNIGNKDLNRWIENARKLADATGNVELNRLIDDYKSGSFERKILTKDSQ